MKTPSARQQTLTRYPWVGDLRPIRTNPTQSWTDGRETVVLAWKTTSSNLEQGLLSRVGRHSSSGITHGRSV